MLSRVAKPEVGDQAPDVSILKPSGNDVRLSHYWRDGPVLTVFLRHYG
jgi:peroxiredoxin